MWNNEKGPRPQTTFPLPSFLPQTRKVTPRERNIGPSLRNVSKTVRNIIRNNSHSIALSNVKTKVTPLGSAKYSRQGLKIKTILNMEKSITRKSSRNLISCRKSTRPCARFQYRNRRSGYLRRTLQKGQ